jgi:hypothetical protein
MRSNQVPPAQTRLRQWFPLTASGFLLFLLLVPAARGEQAAAAGFRVQASGGWINLHVTQTTPLIVVLEELCRPTGSRCEGVQGIDETVPPLTVEGVWTSVISQLLRGTKLDYVVVEGSDSAPARLLVLGRSAAAPTPLESENARAVRAGEELRHIEKSSVSPTNTAPSSDSEPAASKSPVETVEPVIAMTRSLPVGESMNDPPKQLGGFSRPSEPQVPVPNVPMPGFMGGPIIPVLPQPGPPVSAFPDTAGNPVRVVPQPPSTVGMFPDAQGRPVPLIPLPPDQKQKVDSPFPPEISGPR